MPAWTAAAIALVSTGFSGTDGQTGAANCAEVSSARCHYQR
jgi:hypothetical protein